MAFDTLQVKAVEGLLSVTNTIGHRSTTLSWGESTWGETDLTQSFSEQRSKARRLAKIENLGKPSKQ